MAEVTMKRTGELIQKLFQILSKYPEGLQARDALKQLSESMELTDYEKGTYAASGANRFEKIVRFATVSCGKAGWMTKHKGTWAITDEGRKAVDADLPLNFHPAAFRASANVAPFGAVSVPA